MATTHTTKSHAAGGAKKTAKKTAKTTSKKPSHPRTTAKSAGAATSHGAAKSHASAKSVDASGFRVRMYRVGFGDFFLITVPSSDGPKHILVDCGVFAGTTHKGDLGSIDTAVANMVEETGGQLALVIMTHRHADHIIGFSRCADKYAGCKAEAVWMPAWENEYDDSAKKFQADFTSLASRLQVALGAAGPGSDGELAADMLYNALGADALGVRGKGGGSNAASLTFLKTGLGATPSYLASGDEAPLPQSLVDAGLSARILGPPPVSDVEYLKLMDLQKNVGQYLDDDAGPDAEPELSPFGPEWEATAADYPVAAFREWAPRDPDGRPGQAPEIDPAVLYNYPLEQTLAKLQPSALSVAAKTLDSFLNNQSLVVLFTFAGKNLLFAGDAQGGNWEYWLYPGDAPTKTPGDLPEESKAILGSLAFYKVGHHGSTNATPVPAVEAMGKDFVAMCSTQEDVYGNKDKGTEVPRTPLMEALAQKCALVRSDQVPVEVDGAEVAPDEDAGDLPVAKEGKIVAGDGYIDYFLSE